MARKGKSKKKSKTKSSSAKSGSAAVVLDSAPSIQNVGALREQLTVVCEVSSGVVIDAGKVESIDTAALQLLTAFVKSVREQSRTVEWRELSDVFRDMANLADLSQYLGTGNGCAVEDNDDLCPVF